MGRISIVSQMFLPGTFLFVRRYAKNTPRQNAIAVASRATFIDKIIGSIILVIMLFSVCNYFTVNPYFSKTSFAKSLWMNS